MFKSSAIFEITKKPRNHFSCKTMFFTQQLQPIETNNKISRAQQ